MGNHSTAKNDDSNSQLGLSQPILQVLFALSIFLYVNPFSFVSKVEKAEVIGVVKELSGKAYRRVDMAKGASYWVPLKLGSSIFQEDVVRVPKFSRLLVHLRDGQGAWVTEQSMVQFLASKKTNFVKVEKGSATINFFSGNYLLLENGDVIVAKEASQVKLRKLASETSLEILAGKVSILNRQEKRWEALFRRVPSLEVGEKIKIKSQKKKKEAFDLTKSEASWYVELSPSKDFSHEKVIKKKVQNFKDKTYKVKRAYNYWRMAGYTQDQHIVGESGVGSLKKTVKRSRRITFPILKTMKHSVVHAQDNVRFSWESPSEDLRWTLEVAKDEGFNNIRYKVLLGEELFYETSLPTGNWFWRVVGRRVYTDQIYESPTGTLVVEKTSTLRFPASAMKELARSPYQVELNYSDFSDRTKVSWDFDDLSSRYDLGIYCHKQRKLSVRSGQNIAYMELKPFVSCRLRVRSIDKRSLSKWSYPVIIKDNHVGH